MTGWLDTSSHAQSDPYPREPKTWRLELGRRGVALIVTRYHGLPGWVMHLPAFRVDTHQLRSSEVADAKFEALRIARAMLAEALAACDDIEGTP